MYICIYICIYHLLITTMALSIGGMSPQYYCGDEKDRRTGLFSWLHYICIILLLSCLLSTLCVMNQFLYIYIYNIYTYI